MIADWGLGIVARTGRRVTVSVGGQNARFVEREKRKPHKGNHKNNRNNIDRVPKDFEIQHSLVAPTFSFDQGNNFHGAYDTKISNAGKKADGQHVFRR